MADLTRKKVAEEIRDLAKPIDFEGLIKEGKLKQIGKSYYTDDIHALPDHVVKKVREFAKTKRGLRLAFYKPERFQKMAERIKHHLE